MSKDAQRTPPLIGTTVLEVGAGVAGSYCGKLFADMGASVQRVDSPHDAALAAQTLEPNLTSTAGLYQRYLDAGKERISSLPDTPADIVIIGEARAALGSHPKARIATVDISWFGHDGPYADWIGTDLVAQALAGLVYPVGPVDGPPRFLGAHQATLLGGLAGYCAGLAAMLGPTDAGPTALEVSIFESLLILAEHQICFSEARGESVPRVGVNRFVPTCPLSIHRCKRGWIGITPLTPAQWQAFCTMLDLPELAADPVLTVPRERYPHAERMEAAFDSRFPAKTAEDWAALGREHRVPMVVVPDAEGILTHPIFNARESLATFASGEASYRVPRTPLRLERSPPRSVLDAVRHSYPQTDGTAQPRPPARGPHNEPLAGVRIADFSMGWAGPLATRMLADLGAEVIKIEAGRYPDWWRSVDWSPEAIERKQFEESRNFCALNRAKQSISVDLTVPTGRELAKGLVAKCDIVVENQAAGVMPRLGLGYDDLRAHCPDLIMMSMSAFGSGNAWSDTRAYGSVLEQGSGLPSFAGEEGAPPTMAHIAYGDPVGGIYGAASLLSALVHRGRTGEGQWINNTQIEAMLPFTTPALLIRQATGREPRRFANRHPVMSPHGVFATRGVDVWVALAVPSEQAWRGLARLIGRADWAEEPTLATASARRERETEIETAIGAWLASHDAESAAEQLQRAGVAAAPVRRSGEVSSDPHLQARGYFYSVHRAHVGHQWQSGLPFRWDGERFPMHGLAPMFGGDSEAVLCDTVGVTRAEFESLVEAGVVTFQPTGLRAG